MKILDIEIDLEKLKAVSERRDALADAEGDVKSFTSRLADAESDENEDMAAQYRDRLADAKAAVATCKAKLEEVEGYWNGLRRRSQTAPIFLSQVLGYTRIIPRVHGEMFAAQVIPSPDKPVELWEGEKENINLDPRGTFKSTCSIIGCVQCIICDPNVRICCLTATKPLAKAIANEIGGHFELASHAEPKLFHLLFPEFCVRPDDRNDGQYTAPCRTRPWREETVMAFSIETSMSGWHFDIINPDDPVDGENSSTPAGVKKIKRKYRINKKTLMPWGFINYKGTIYDPFDLGRDMIEKAKPGKSKVLVRGAFTMKNGDRFTLGMDFPPASDIVLLFPELLSYEFLKKEYEDDQESFMTQYMNDAHGGKEVTFTKEALLQVVVAEESLPVTGRKHIAWRFACSGKENMRYAGAAVGLEEHGRVYVVDALRGMYAPSTLAHKVVQLAKAHGEHEVQIEETPGARQLEASIKNYGLIAHWPIEIRWTEYQEDDAARELRIKSAEPMVAMKRLWFSSGVKILAEVFRQFANYGMVEEFEIPDVVSRVTGLLPTLILAQQQDAEQDLAWQMAQEKEMYDMTHGIGRYGAPPPIEPAQQPELPLANSYGLDDALGGLNG